MFYKVSSPSRFLLCANYKTPSVFHSLGTLLGNSTLCVECWCFPTRLITHSFTHSLVVPTMLMPKLESLPTVQVRTFVALDVSKVQ